MREESFSYSIDREDLKTVAEIAFTIYACTINNENSYKIFKHTMMWPCVCLQQLLGTMVKKWEQMDVLNIL